jgi:hypothetical protein
LGKNIVALTAEELRHRHLRRRRKPDGPAGPIDDFGMADFNKNTLVLRYSGRVGYKILQKRGLH